MTPRLVRELVRDATLVDRVVQELERLIVESRLEDGDRLPSERELAGQFGVSRTVVREAVRGLAARRLLDVGGGRGTTVRAPSAAAASESMKLLLQMQAGGADTEKVSEVRRILENEISALAASRRTDADLDALEAILDAAERNMHAPDAFVMEDVAFHSLLAQATQNELFVVILESLAHVMLEVRLLALRIPGTASRALAHHRRVLDSVRAGDPVAARDAMNRHMDEARQTLAQAVGPDVEAES